ncbi:MAG: membrane protein insertion efficiency factor YidD [Quisquiliibacterium sp.]
MNSVQSTATKPSRSRALKASLWARPAAALAWLISLPIRGYRYAISPMLPASCRFFPSCSEYALESLRRHGPLAGGWLTVTRLCRCHPWNPGGVDPVPDTFPPSIKKAGRPPIVEGSRFYAKPRTGAPLAPASRWPAAQSGKSPASTD